MSPPPTESIDACVELIANGTIDVSASGPPGWLDRHCSGVISASSTNEPLAPGVSAGTSTRVGSAFWHAIRSTT